MGETPWEAAIRESMEEASLTESALYYELQTVSSVPRNIFAGSSHWPAEIYTIPQYSFAVNCQDESIVLSEEHSEFRWDSFDSIHDQLHWDSNKVALWELNQRLLDNALPNPFQISSFDN